MKTAVITIAVAALALCTAPAQVPSILNYQGRVTVGGTNLTTNAAQFKFALVDSNGTTVYWKNDGTTTTDEPANAVSVAVSQGLYSTLLGDTALANMAALPSSVFTNADVNLRVWFSAGGTNPFVPLAPDQRLGAAGYALRAAVADTAAVTNVPGDLSVGGVLSAAQLAGGSNSLAGGFLSTIAGGAVNLASGSYSAIVGGLLNVAGADYSFVGGGYDNEAISSYATIGGGTGNIASSYSSVVGGVLNVADGGSSFVGGGSENRAMLSYATIGGGLQNTNNSFGGTIGGGQRNITVLGDYATVGGGWSNTASGLSATVGGGSANTTGNDYATIGGGSQNTNTALAGTIGGGTLNTVSARSTTVAGGESNTNTADYATVGGGVQNAASGYIATIGGGVNNTASGGYSVVGGGETNTVSGNRATIGGGSQNTAAGSYATVPGGVRSFATNTGAFVWGSDPFEDTGSFGNNTFTVRAEGGARFYTANGTGTGVNLSAGSGAWNNLSDRGAKANFRKVDATAVLAKVAAMPVMTWNYRTQDESIRHIGPTAQDFRAAFGLGENDKTISTIDPSGVALAAIQGLVEELKLRDKTIEELKAKLDAVEQRLESFPPAP